MKNIFKIVSIALAVATLSSVSTASLAAGGGNENLDKVYINMNDKESLRNGAKLFVNYCLSCHSAEYSRYNRVASDLDIPLDALQGNLMFASDKTGDKMITSMSAEDAKRWFGVTPPDLTLVSRVRKPNWVYTYLRSFYQDDNSPSGWNNSLFQNVAMPHVMYELQGAPKLVSMPGEAEEAAADKEADESVYVAGGATFDMSHRGKLSNAEFDSAMRDLTNFLVYLAEPAQLQRKTIGVWTMVFLTILLLLAIMLKKEYWRDVH